MWVRESQPVIDQEYRAWSQKRFNPLRPFFVVLIICSLYAISQLLGCRGEEEPPGTPVPWEQWPSTIAEHLPEFTIVVVALSIGGYLLQLWFGPLTLEDRGRTLICVQCFKTRSVGAENTCECGAPCEPIENWKWVED